MEEILTSRNTFGLTPLLIATWRNHIPIIKRLLAAGAAPNGMDGESGWSSLHRALHFGQLVVAGILLKNDASVAIEDSKSRTPLDLLSGPVLRANGNGDGLGTLTSMPLKSLCEKAATEHLVEPRSALQLLEIADSLEAHDLNETFFFTFLQLLKSS